MALILDTNALSAFADGDPGLRAAIAGDSDLALPAIVLGEYLYGVRQSRWRARYQGWLRAHLHLFLLLPVVFETAAHYADIRSELKAAGRPIPSNDLWIAALAREHSHAVVSRDRHFESVRGLHRIGW